VAFAPAIRDQGRDAHSLGRIVVFAAPLRGLAIA
jgi:hypothetical protein